jgi:hypothetical protein
VDFAVDFSSDFSGKTEEFVQNGLKIFKNFRRSRQSTTWPIRDPATVYFFGKVNQLATVHFSKKNPTTVDFSKRNPATVDLPSKVDCRLQGLVLALKFKNSNNTTDRGVTDGVPTVVLRRNIINMYKESSAPTEPLNTMQS